MRTPGVAGDGVAVRVLLDIERDEDGRVTGRVIDPAGAAVRFCGWLELLHLLEDVADTTLPERGGRT